MKNTLLIITFFVVSVSVSFAQQPAPTPIVINRASMESLSIDKTLNNNGTIIESDVQEDSLESRKYVSSNTIVDVMDSNQINALNIVARNEDGNSSTKFQIVVFMRKKYVSVSRDYLEQIIELNQPGSVIFKADTISEGIILNQDSYDIIKTNFNYVPTLMLAQHFKAYITQEQVLALLSSQAISFTNQEGKFSAKLVGIKMMKDFIQRELNRRKMRN